MIKVGVNLAAGFGLVAGGSALVGHGMKHDAEHGGQVGLGALAGTLGALGAMRTLHGVAGPAGAIYGLGVAGVVATSGAIAGHELGTEHRTDAQYPARWVQPKG